LQIFTKPGIAALKSRLNTAYIAKQSGKSFDHYFQPAFLREVHGCMARLMPFLEKTKCYHKIKNESGGVRTSPCKFQNIRPAIQFELTREAGRLNVRAIIKLGNLSCPLAELHRSHFLVEKKMRYITCLVTETIKRWNG